MTNIDTLCESTKLRLIAAADGLMACKRTAGHIIPMQGKDCVIAIGPRDWIAKHVAGMEVVAAASGDVERLTNEEIDIIWQTMPGGPAAWFKAFGYQQFAKAIEDEVILSHERTRLVATTQASTAQAERSGAATEGLELLDSLIAGIDRSGNYSVEATLTFLGQIRQCFAAPVAQEAATSSTPVKHGEVPSIEITLRQAKALVDCFGGNDAEISIIERPAAWVDMPDGLYAYFSEYPEEGSMYLGETEVQDEADATSSTDAQAAAEVRDAALDAAIIAADDAYLSAQCSIERGEFNQPHRQTREAIENAIRALRAGDTGEQADGGEHG